MGKTSQNKDREFNLSYHKININKKRLKDSSFSRINENIYQDLISDYHFFRINCFSVGGHFINIGAGLQL